MLRLNTKDSRDMRPQLENLDHVDGVEVHSRKEKIILSRTGSVRPTRDSERLFCLANFTFLRLLLQKLPHQTKPHVVVWGTVRPHGEHGAVFHLPHGQRGC